ncbi:hypothetical protein PPS11_13941 [Pseudomonas putida S11]|nr:hypothetical protein PPS11_13941 [Pseudomonas putida S11]
MIQAYRVGDLGLVYPLMRGLSPLVVLGLTLAFAGESLSQQQIIGILLIPCGMACLLWQGGGGDRLPWSMLPVVALIGLCIGCYTWFDGQAVRLWGKPWDYLVWLTLLSAWPFPLLASVAPTCAIHLVLAPSVAPGAGGGAVCTAQLRAGAVGHAPGVGGRSGGVARVECDSGGAAGHALPERTFWRAETPSLRAGVGRHAGNEALTRRLNKESCP